MKAALSRYRNFNIGMIICGLMLGAHSSVHAEDGPITYTQGDQIRVKTPKVEKQFINPWPAAYEEAYWKRAQHLLSLYKDKSDKRLWGEGEKWSYPISMLAYMANHGHPEMQKQHVAVLGATEGSPDHTSTYGVDLYWSFTLKGQTRKYFQFAPELTADYLETMRKAMKVWSADDVKPGFETILLFDSTDPELHDYAAKAMEKMTGQSFGKDREKWRAYWKQYSDQGWKIFEDYERLKNIRPHPVHGIGKGPVGGAWDPKIRGFWADARNTDNLRAMRECAAYLFAEEVGNELTRKIYKQKIKRTAFGFMGIGMGEWDSTSYLSHTMTAYLTLYDYAKDPEVKAYAKAILDYLSTTGAIKYFYGSWGAPVARDYGTIGPWSSASSSFYAYFGGTKAKPKKGDYDWAHILGSGYRPPMAAVKLAEKGFAEPVEMLNSHPTYSNWLPGADEKPAFYSTLFFNKNFFLGTQAMGSRGDVAGNKLVIRDKNNLGSYLIFASNKSKNVPTSTSGQDRIAQYRNLMIFLSKNKTDGPFQLLLSQHFPRETVDGVIFVHADHTFVAIRPLGIEMKGERKKKSRRSYDSVIIDAQGKGGPAVGYIMEVGDKNMHGSYEKFKEGVLKQSKVKADLNKMTVRYTDAKGHSVGIDASPKGLPMVWRNGKKHDWTQHVDVFKPADGSKQPVSLSRNSYQLHIDVGGYTFTGTLKDGSYVSQSSGPGLSQ